MFAYSVRRILGTIPLLLIATFLIYWLVSLSGDPLARLATCQTCTQEDRQRIIDDFDLDEPIVARYAGWLGDAVTGDMGESSSLGDNAVFPIVRERAWNTAKIALPAMLFIGVLSVALGVYSAVRQYAFSDFAFTGFAFLGISMPVFFFALLLQAAAIRMQTWFSVKPFFIHGMRGDGIFTLEFLQSVTLPILTLVFVIVARESRFERASMLEVIHADYIRTARAKGLPERRIILKHALRNALIPLVTIWAIDFAFLMGGSVVTETIFSWPGLGPLLLDGIYSQDINLTMAIVMLISVLVIVLNLVADLLYGWLDPRIRYE